MFACVSGFHASLPDTVCYTVVELGKPISPKFVVTTILGVYPTHREAFLGACDGGQNTPSTDN